MVFKCCGWVLCGILLSVSAWSAPLAPDAGQTQRELKKQADLIPPKPTPASRVESDAATAHQLASGRRYLIKSIRIVDHHAFSTPELSALVEYLIGGEYSVTELSSGAARITAWYRAHGYLVARAYLPKQALNDGILTIKILEGTLGQQRIHNQSRLSPEKTAAYLQNIQANETLLAEPIDRALLLLADTPGVGGARAILQPGASVGTSDLIVELDPASKYAANVALNNYGNRYTGEYALRAGLDLNSPFHLGDQLGLRALVSDQNMTYRRIAYQLPVGGQGWRVGATYSDTRYHLGREFIPLQARGTAENSSFFASYPLIRSTPTNLFATLTWERKVLIGKTNKPISTAQNQIQLLNFGLAGKHQDSRWGGGITAWDTALISGNFTIDAASQAIDALSARSNGAFTRLAYTFSRTQRLSEHNLLGLVISGQQSNKNLYSSEKFSLGGATGVRAYPQSEGSGDQGWMANLEIRHNFQGDWQGIVFYDAGSVMLNRIPFSATPNIRRIAGAGLGINTAFEQLQLQAFLAWRTQGGAAQSVPTTVNTTPTLWIQMNSSLN